TLPSASAVDIRIYDLLGNEVAVLAKGMQNAGIHSLVWNASTLASGTYYCRMKSGDFDQTRKMILLK
ncbi:MAG: T9SS type A sorting domain-containing protein, partial [Ignavibacteriales bacterium]|nr:T9SS type A sorting domain-containing protein [Ignavibacteriales bacterium]